MNIRDPQRVQPLGWGEMARSPGGDEGWGGDVGIGVTVHAGERIIRVLILLFLPMVLMLVCCGHCGGGGDSCCGGHGGGGDCSGLVLGEARGSPSGGVGGGVFAPTAAVLHLGGAHAVVGTVLGLVLQVWGQHMLRQQPILMWWGLAMCRGWGIVAVVPIATNTICRAGTVRHKVAIVVVAVVVGAVLL